MLATQPKRLSLMTEGEFLERKRQTTGWNQNSDLEPKNGKLGAELGRNIGIAWVQQNKNVPVVT
jgi:hypothetical protein